MMNKLIRIHDFGLGVFLHRHRKSVDDLVVGPGVAVPQRGPELLIRAGARAEEDRDGFGAELHRVVEGGGAGCVDLS